MVHGKAVWLSAILATVLVLTPAIGLAFYFRVHSLPKTTIWGQDVGGLNREQVKQAIEELHRSQVVSLSLPDGSTTQVTPTQIGAVVDHELTTERVMASGDGGVLSNLRQGREVRPVVTIDEQALSPFLDQLAPPEDQDSVEPTIVPDQESGDFVVVPGTDGQAIDTERLKNDLVQTLEGELGGTLGVHYTAAQPTLSLQNAAAIADKANLIRGQSVTIGDGQAVIASASPDEISSWITFHLDGPTPGLTIDQEAVAGWVEEAAISTNTHASRTYQNTDESGQVVRTFHQGSPGQTADNTAELTRDLVSALESGSGYSGTVTYSASEPELVQLPLSAEEVLPYSPSPGEKWIDLDLSKNQVTTYEGTTPILRTPIVQGATATPTVTGQFAIYIKYQAEDMAGLEVDGSPWAYPAVPYPMYFNGLYALHGSYWRDDFGADLGENGSHGCANMPVGAAQAIFEWAPIGTKVISHR